MTKVNYALVVAASIVVSACSSPKTENQASEEQTESQVPAESVPVTSGKYKIKSGTIHYETSAGDFKTKKIVYFDDYGSKERVENYEDDGTLKGYNTSDGKIRYYVDIQNKTAWISDKNGSLGWEMQFASWDDIESRGNEKKEFTRVDNITVAGKDCEAYDYKGMAVFAGWNGLTLYHKQKPNILSQAVKLEENVDHDDAFFAVPEGFEVKERQ